MSFFILAFVKEILFPYAVKHVHQYLIDTFSTQQTLDDINALITLSKQDAQQNTPNVPFITEHAPTSPVTYDPSTHSTLLDQIVANVHWQISTDRKSTALKQLQGHIWQHGYTSGEIVSQVYDDVLPNLYRWKEAGISLYIYSSGSIGAQKLLFAHTSQGNVCKLFNDYFDTTTGMKQEVS